MTPSEQIVALLRVDENGLLPEAIYAGRLPTLSNDVYPGLGSWWVQLRTTDIIHARVFANSPEEAHEKAELLSAAWNIRPVMRQMVRDIQELRKEIEYEQFAEGVVRSRFKKILETTKHYENL